MTNDDQPWEPSPWEPLLAGTEGEHLVGALDRLRATFRWKADGLDSAGLQARVGASTVSSSHTSPRPTVVRPVCAGSSAT